MTGLLLHCGAEAIERDAIKNLPVKRATKTHHPVSNERLVNLTHDALGRHGFRVLDAASDTHLTLPTTPYVVICVVPGAIKTRQVTNGCRADG